MTQLDNLLMPFNMFVHVLPIWSSVCCIVCFRMFVHVYDLIILVNAVFIGLDEENPVVSNAEWGFLVLYMLEIILKLYATEPRAFFARHHFWNW